MEILSKPTAELSTINRGTGSKEAGYILMESIILMVLEWFAIEWPEGQSRECAEILYDDYYYLQIAELKHFVIKVKAGHFDKSILKNKINPTTLIDWMGQYADESLKIRQANYINNSYSDTSNERADARIKEWNKDEDDFRMSAEMNRIKDELKSKQPKTDAA